MENTNVVLALMCLIGSIVLIGFLLVFASVRLVPADRRLAVYRLGQYLGDKGPGIVILIPFIDRGVMKEAGVPEKSPPRD